MLPQDEIDKLMAGYEDEEDRGSRGGALIVVAAVISLCIVIALIAAGLRAAGG